MRRGDSGERDASEAVVERAEEAGEGERNAVRRRRRDGARGCILEAGIVRRMFV